MRAVVGEETEIMEHDLGNSYDCIAEMTKKSIEERDNKDYRLITY